MRHIRSLIMLVLAVIAGEGVVSQTTAPAGAAVVVASVSPVVATRAAPSADGDASGAPRIVSSIPSIPLGARAENSGSPWAAPAAASAAASASPSAPRRKQAAHGSADQPRPPLPPYAPRVASCARPAGSRSLAGRLWPAHGIRAGPLA